MLVFPLMVMVGMVVRVIVMVVVRMIVRILLRVVVRILIRMVVRMVTMIVGWNQYQPITAHINLYQLEFCHLKKKLWS